MHRDGDWHRALHLWVLVRGPGGPCVVLQRRSLAKDTHPGLVDVSVAGHLGASETVYDALREAEEEIGLAVSPADTVLLGHRRVEKVVPVGVDREVQTVLATRCEQTLADLRPHPEEVAALYAPRLVEALALARGDVPLIVADRIDALVATGRNSMWALAQTVRAERVAVPPTGALTNLNSESDLG